MPKDSNLERLDREAMGTRTWSIREMWDYLGHHKKWWMLPILAVFVIFGVLMLIGGTAAAPFIYTLF